MTTWKEEGGYYAGGQGAQPPPAGFYPYPQQGYPGGGFTNPNYPNAGGYPPTGGQGYPPTGGPGYPPTGGAGYPPPGAGYPPPGAGYPPPSAGGYPGAGDYYGGYPGGAGSPPGTAMPGYNATGYGEDPMGSNSFDFSDKTIRRGFIRKVYGILMIQLTITLGFVSLFTFNDATKLYVARNPALWWVSLGVMFVCLITMACCGDVRRKAPMNFIFLGLFTVAESFLLGCATATFRSEEVFLAVAICTVVTLGLTIFAFQTKIDFTMMGGILFVAVLILMIFGIVMMFWHNKIATLVYASLGAFIFSVYIVYDTQIMLGGKHKYAISPEEYIFAALNLYLDIINLFMYILTIIGASRD